MRTFTRTLSALILSTLVACQGSGEPADDDTAPTSTLVINEFMASNQATIADEAGAFPDWIEIHNTGTEAVDLTGHFLSDDLANPTKWQFGDGLTVPGGGFLMVWADGDEADGADHASFSLAADGEALGLFSPVASGLATIDSITFEAQATDVSMARTPDGSESWAADSSPSPGASNQ